MSVENDFIPFAVGESANVLTQSAYAALTALTQNGFSGGIAPSIQLNKVWRQSSIMAAVLAQFISQNTGQPAIDDGTTVTLLANLSAATAGRLLNIQYFTASGAYTPTPGTNSVIFEAQGGGGGGGGAPTTGASENSSGGGGAGGSWGRKRLSAGFAGATITIGAGGSVTTGAIGGTGGTTTIACTAGTFAVPGGQGGQIIGPNPSASFFYSSGGSTLSTTGAWDQSHGGSPGLIGMMYANLAIGGTGGGSVYGSAGTAVGGGPGGGAFDGFGGGGGGGSIGPSTNGVTGGPGKPGIVVVFEYA